MLSTVGIQAALDYLESHMEDSIDMEQAAERTGMPVYHFSRLFSMLTGMSVTEYVRNRRLTLAAADLQRGMKVIDVGMKYGYDSPDSFSRAFCRFHGMPPSEARVPGGRLNCCLPLHIHLSLEGAGMLDYKIENKPALRMLGYRRHFTGVPDDAERFEQEERMFVSTRAHQWMLRGIADTSYVNLEYVAITDVREDGYDFWYGALPDPWCMDHYLDSGVTGIDFMDRFGFEILNIPAGSYAVFRTEPSRHPTQAYAQLRTKIAQEWFPATGYTLRDGPEMAVYHWKFAEEKDRRYIEIWLPVE